MAGPGKFMVLGCNRTGVLSLVKNYSVPNVILNSRGAICREDADVLVIAGVEWRTQPIFHSFLEVHICVQFLDLKLFRSTLTEITAQGRKQTWPLGLIVQSARFINGPYFFPYFQLPHNYNKLL